MFLEYLDFLSKHPSVHISERDNIGLLHGYGVIKRGFKSRLGWRPWEPS